MALTVKEKAARHRQRIQNDPAAREAYLAKRKESYQRRIREGKIVKPRISQLSRKEQEKRKQQWRQDQKRHRERRRATEEILNLTPESLDTTPTEPPAEPQPSPPNTDRENIVSIDVMQPTASSTPQRASTNINKNWLREKAKMHRKIHRMKRQIEAGKRKSEKLLKRIQRLRAKKKAKSTTEKNRSKNRAKKLNKERKERVVEFLCRDENSRLLPGRKDTVTKNKSKQQRCVLVTPLNELHLQYNTEMQKSHKLSYRQFLRYRPFFVTQAKASDRNSCSCLDHENVKLLAEKLQQKGLLETSSISQLLTLIVCSPDNRSCMYRVCAKCCYNEVEVATPQMEETVTWHQWIRKPVSEGQKIYINFVKEEQTGTCSELLNLFNQRLNKLAKHHYNWLHQAKECRALKESLRDDEVVLHVNFSENFSCKFHREVQSLYFGGSRKQATVHTCVAYTAAGSQSYATISASLRHYERAVWAHLEPVLRDVKKNFSQSPTTLHVMSDGPVTQYRNKKNFYLLSTIPFLSGFQHVTWNFSEKSHGKGAPDGVGGAVKRTADSAVQRGADVQTPEDFYSLLTDRKSDIKYFWVSEEDIRRFDEAVPEVVPPVKGTLALHQVISTEPGKIMHREISCFCSRPHSCQCHNTTMVILQPASAQDENEPQTTSAQDENEPPTTSAQDENEPQTASAQDENEPQTASAQDENDDLNGKFILVKYEGRPFVGQVLQVIGDEVEVSCMEQLGRKNKFTWPYPADIIFYYTADVLKVISEPEPHSRHTRLTNADWESFSVHT